MPTSLAFSSVILVIGLLAGVGAGVVIWQQTRQSDEAAVASPSPEPANLAAAEATPSASPTWFPVTVTLVPSLRPAQRPSEASQLAGEGGKSAAEVGSRPSPTVASATATAPRITWLDLPSSVSSGERFTIRWRIDGPAGARGEKTTLKVVYETSQHSSGSSAAASSNSSNSFGPFTVPAMFDSQFSFGSAPATIRVTATADVGGREVSATAAIPLK